MKSLILISALVLSISVFSQDMITCFDARDIVDGGFGFQLNQTASGLSAEVTEMTIAGPKTIASIENTQVMRTNYSKLNPSLNACALSVIGKQDTEFGHKVMRVNLFKDGFIGMSVQEYVVGYLHCSYLQSKNPDIICNPGGGDNLILVNEYIQTTKNLAYAVAGRKNTQYSQVKCVKSEYSVLITDLLNCEDQTTLKASIDL